MGDGGILAGGRRMSPYKEDGPEKCVCPVLWAQRGVFLPLVLWSKEEYVHLSSFETKEEYARST